MARGRVRLRPSLRVQLAVVIALLSLLPNLAMATLVLLPSYRELGRLAPGTLPGLTAWLVAVVLLSGVIGWALARVLLAPLTRATRDAEALPYTARHLARARLPVAGDEPPEVASLKRALNRLLEQVQTEQRRRSAFTATLMHDMKTPLLAEGNLLQVLRDQPELPGGERQRLIEAMLRENGTVLRLVQQLVDAHRLERGELDPRPEPTALRELVERAAERVRPMLAERGVRLHVEGRGEAEVDGELVERAMINLLANAGRYAQETVRVQIRRGMIRIADDGPGLPLPLEELARPFNDQPMEIAGQRYAVGSGGLGLYIARSILEAHGGRLVEEATAPSGTALLAYLGGSPVPERRPRPRHAEEAPA